MRNQRIGEPRKANVIILRNELGKVYMFLDSELAENNMFMNSPYA